MLIETGRSQYQENVKFYVHIRRNNPQVLWDMRAKLISWMMEVSSEFALRRETLHNSVILLDTWLGKTNNFSNNHLQLLALGCLFICSKIEELYPPTAANFAFTANNFFSELEIKTIESNICKKLNWNLIYVTPNKIFGCLSQIWDELLDQKWNN